MRSHFDINCHIFQVLALFLLSDCLPGSKTTVLEEAYNRNLLVTFLVVNKKFFSSLLAFGSFMSLAQNITLLLFFYFFQANLLTGLVNLLVDTLFASSVKALSVMIAYAFMLSFIPGLLDFCGIRLKFW